MMIIPLHPMTRAIALASALGATAMLAGCQPADVEPTPAPMESAPADGMSPATPPSDGMDPAMPPASDPGMPPTDPSVPQPTDPGMPPPTAPSAPTDADPALPPPVEGTPEPVG